MIALNAVLGTDSTRASMALRRVQAVNKYTMAKFGSQVVPISGAFRAGLVAANPTRTYEIKY